MNFSSLRCFGHIQRMSPKTPVHSDILSYPKNTRREKCRPKLTQEGTIKRYFKECNISKKFALDRSAWKITIHVPEP
jgi:hypothetical protein